MAGFRSSVCHLYTSALWIILIVGGFIQANTNEDGTIFLERGYRGIVPCPPVASGRITLDQIDAMYWYFRQLRDEDIVISYFLRNVAPQNGIPEGVYDINGDFCLVIENVTDSAEGAYYCRVKPKLKGIVDGHVDMHVKVSPKEPFPDVTQCTRRILSKCEAELPNNIKQRRLTCIVRDTKPAVALQWMLEYSDGDTQLLSDRFTVQPSEYSVNTFITSASIPVIASDVNTLYRCQAYGEALGARNDSHVTVNFTTATFTPQTPHFTSRQPTTTLSIESTVNDNPDRSGSSPTLLVIGSLSLVGNIGLVAFIVVRKISTRKAGRQHYNEVLKTNLDSCGDCKATDHNMNKETDIV